MSNIDFFKQDISIGDVVLVELTSGKSVQGKVLEISNYILLEKEDGKKVRLLDGILGGWELVSQHIEDINEATLMKDEAPSKADNDEGTRNNLSDEDSDNDEDSDDDGDDIELESTQVVDLNSLKQAKNTVIQLYSSMIQEFYSSPEELTPTNAVITNVSESHIFVKVNDFGSVKYTHSSLIGYNIIRNNPIGSRLYCPHIPMNKDHIAKGKRGLVQMTYSRLSSLFEEALLNDQYLQLRRIAKLLSKIASSPALKTEVIKLNNALKKYNTLRSILNCQASFSPEQKRKLFSLLEAYIASTTAIFVDTPALDVDFKTFKRNILAKIGVKISKAYYNYIFSVIIPAIKEEGASAKRLLDNAEISSSDDTLTREQLSQLKSECLQGYMEVIKSSSLKPNDWIHTNATISRYDETDSSYGKVVTNSGTELFIGKSTFIGMPSMHLAQGAKVFVKQRTNGQCYTIGLMTYNELNQYYAKSVKEERFFHAYAILKYLSFAEIALTEQRELIKSITDKIVPFIKSEDIIPEESAIVDDRGELHKQPSSNNPIDEVSTENQDDASLKGSLSSMLSEAIKISHINLNDMIPSNAAIKYGGIGAGIQAKHDDGTSLNIQTQFFIGEPSALLKDGVRLFTRPKEDGTCNVTVEEMTYNQLFDFFNKFLSENKLHEVVIIIKALRSFTTLSDADDVLKQMYQKVKNALKKDDNIRLYQDLSKEEVAKLSTFIKDIIANEDHNSPISDFQIVSSYNKEYGCLLHTSAVATIRKDLGIDNPLERSLSSSDTYIGSNCTIDKYFAWYNNGAAKSSEHPEIRFKDEIVDPVLLGALKSFRKGDAPVPGVCGITKSGRYVIAQFIVQPGTVSSIYKTAKFFEDTGNKEVADSIKAFLAQQITETGSIPKSSFPSMYIKARELRGAHDYPQAERIFLSLIKEKYQLDTVVKDLADMYREMGQTHDALKLMEDKIDLLENKQKAYNFISNIYSGIGDYPKTIEYMKKAYDLIDSSEIKLRIKALVNIAKQYILLKDTNSAREVLLKAKKLGSNHEVNKLLEQVKDKIPTKLTKALSFRAPHLLETDQKLSNKLILSEKASELLAKAKLAVSEQREKDYSESMYSYSKTRYIDLLSSDKLGAAQDYMVAAQQIKNTIVDESGMFLLASLILNDPIELASVEMSDDFETFLTCYQPNSACERVLYLFINCFSPAAVPQILNSFYDNEIWRTWICGLIGHDSLERALFRKTLLKKGELFANEETQIKAKLTELRQKNNSSDMARCMMDVFSVDPSKYLSQNDFHSITEMHDVVQQVNAISLHDDYQIAEERVSSLSKRISDISSTITAAPTELTLVYILPALEKCDYVLKNFLNNLAVEKSPVINIDAVTYARINDKNCSLQLKISNKEGCSKVVGTTIRIVNCNGRDIAEKQYLYTLKAPLYGGNSSVFEIDIEVTEEEIETRVLNLQVQLTYLDKDSISKNISMTVETRIDDSMSFKPYVNKFIKFANGQEVTDYSMVKGREGLIQTIVDRAVKDRTGSIIYGQRRSGKSTVLYHVWDRIQKNKRYFTVKMSMLPLTAEDNPVIDETSFLGDLYYTIISEILRKIKKENRKVYKDNFGFGLNCEDFQAIPNSKFIHYLDRAKDVIVEHLGYEDDRIILIIDEFTSLYAEILAGHISGTFIGQMKKLSEEGSITFILSGHDVMPKFFEAYPNEFAIFKKEPVTSIDELASQELVERPVWDIENDKSRYEKDAIQRIIRLSGYNPFFIQIICSEVIDYAIKNRISVITEYDVNIVANRMITSEAKLRRGDFDNLIPIGENKSFHEKVFGLNLDDVTSIMKEISSREQEFVPTNSLHSVQKQAKKNVISYLLARNVLEPHPQHGRELVKIKVGIFKEWLRKNE